MRPNLIVAGLWTAWCCALLGAQTSDPRALDQHPTDQRPADQRPSRLRDSGVITRVAPPATLDGASALGDRAWVQAPARTPATNPPASPPTQTPITTAVQPTASSRLSDAPGQVVPAQFVSQNQSQSPARPELTTATNPGRGPRPLKPPTVAGSDAGDTAGSSTAQMFVSVLSSLALVIGLIFAAAWCYRKAAPKISGALPKQVVQVLGRTPLAPRQQLVLLRLGSKLVLVSNLHGEVRTISEITDPLEVDRLAGLCEAAQPGSISNSFRSVLHNIGRND